MVVAGVRISTELGKSANNVTPHSDKVPPPSDNVPPPSDKVPPPSDKTPPPPNNVPPPPEDQLSVSVGFESSDAATSEPIGSEVTEVTNYGDVAIVERNIVLILLNRINCTDGPSKRYVLCALVPICKCSYVIRY